MSRILRAPASFVFAVAVLGSLGLGVSQAFAAPSTPTDSEARYCTGPDCKWQGSQCVCW
jgi:hypothetical protein